MAKDYKNGLKYSIIFTDYNKPHQSAEYTLHVFGM